MKVTPKHDGTQRRHSEGVYVCVCVCVFVCVSSTGPELPGVAQWALSQGEA